VALYNWYTLKGEKAGVVSTDPPYATP
jgi:hypothetical protein